MKRPFVNREDEGSVFIYVLPAIRSKLITFEKTAKMRIVITNKTIEIAAANPQSLRTLTWASTIVEIIVTLGPPNKAGVIKKPRERTKTKTTPAPMPGRLSGREFS